MTPAGICTAPDAQSLTSAASTAQCMANICTASSYVHCAPAAIALIIGATKPSLLASPCGSIVDIFFGLLVLCGLQGRAYSCSLNPYPMSVPTGITNFRVRGCSATAHGPHRSLRFRASTMAYQGNGHELDARRVPRSSPQRRVAPGTVATSSGNKQAEKKTGAGAPVRAGLPQRPSGMSSWYPSRPRMRRGRLWESLSFPRR